MPPGDFNHGYSLHPLILLLAVLGLLIFATSMLWGWNSHRLYIYTASRELAKLSTAVRSAHLPEITAEKIVVKHYPGDEQEAQLVMDAAEEFLQPVLDLLDYPLDRKVVLLVYPNREKLNQYFGWPADESAMGVYWAGTIKVLAPREWIDAEDQEHLRQVFYKTGPVAHELAHLVVDYRTRGNYSRWFTEGIAQYVELNLTGFKFNDRAGSLEDQRYGLQQLSEGFENLANQSLAYRQSLAAVYYLVEIYGKEAILETMDLLGRGYSLEEAFLEIYGIDLNTFEYQLNDWLDDNWQLFN
ncbi:peptidase MA family metallohydrolase [Desulfofalx alkaliphila]|uniref:peptidase MA family metallohydrolase n=1 Tax=Desulfofalx alkaliphila TaxID=105483 RepID=UPI000554912F|nr:peptidase MA family metallohydrolase [Desulfofalx alkaliphila]